MSNNKKVLFGEEADSPILQGIKIAADAVKSTHGARGRTVLIESENHTGHITATKDGVTVLRSIHLKDSAKNLGVKLIRQAATKTVSEAGDGTTTATSLVDAIVSNAREFMTQENNVVEVTRHIENCAQTINEIIEGSSIPVNETILRQVATVSANNDTFIGDIIADAYEAVGRDGIVIHQQSKNHETYFETTDGIRIDRGLISPRHITDPKIISCEMKNPYVLVTDLKVSDISSIQSIVEHARKDARPILIIGEMEYEAMATFDLNIERGNISGAYIIPPQFGTRREEAMSDIAAAVGAVYVTSKTGSNWSSIGPECLGSAESVTVTKSGTVIRLSPDENTKNIIKERVLMLKDQLAEETQDHEIEYLRERIANLQGKVATVFVGGRTDAEQKEKIDRVDDSIRATQAAIEKGITSGGGIAYIDAIGRPESLKTINPESTESDRDVAIRIMQQSLSAPFRQIIENAGKNPHDIYAALSKEIGQGYDVRTGQSGNMMEMGIIDPAKVVMCALSNAVSAAVTVIMTSVVIINDQE